MPIRRASVLAALCLIAATPASARVATIPSDVNGDGLADVLVGIGDFAFAAADPTGRHSGGGDTEDLVYVVYGSRSSKPVVIGQRRRGGPIAIRRGSTPAGRVIRHDRKSCRCTVFAVAPVGDVGGDRRDDLGIVLKQFFDDDDVLITPRDLEGDARLAIAYGSGSSRPVKVPATGGRPSRQRTGSTSPSRLET